MAITTYENHIPPSLEHLVWGGGTSGPTTTKGNCYICSGCAIRTESYFTNTSGNIPARVLYVDTSYIVIGTLSAYSNNIYKIFRNSMTNDKLITIVDYGDTPLILDDYMVDDKDYYLDMLPSCWLSYMSSTFNIKFVYKLPIR